MLLVAGTPGCRALEEGARSAPGRSGSSSASSIPASATPTVNWFRVRHRSAPSRPRLPGLPRRGVTLAAASIRFYPAADRIPHFARFGPTGWIGGAADGGSIAAGSIRNRSGHPDWHNDWQSRKRSISRAQLAGAADDWQLARMVIRKIRRARSRRWQDKPEVSTQTEGWRRRIERRRLLG